MKESKNIVLKDTSPKFSALNVCSFSRNCGSSRLRKQSGFSLIEVMISAFVLSISLLGILGMQVHSMKGTQHSYMKQQAMSIVQNIMERMAANRVGVVSGEYDDFDTDNFNCGTTPPECTTKACSVSDIALLDKLNIGCGYKVGSGPSTGGLKLESAEDIVSLIDGRLQVSCRPIVGVVNCANGDVTVSVEWTERALGDETVTKDSLSLNLKIAPQ